MKTISTRKFKMKRPSSETEVKSLSSLIAHGLHESQLINVGKLPHRTIEDMLIELKKSQSPL